MKKTNLVLFKNFCILSVHSNERKFASLHRPSATQNCYQKNNKFERGQKPKKIKEKTHTQISKIIIFRRRLFLCLYFVPSAWERKHHRFQRYKYIYWQMNRTAHTHTHTLAFMKWVEWKKRKTELNNELQRPNKTFLNWQFGFRFTR